MCHMSAGMPFSLHWRDQNVINHHLIRQVDLKCIWFCVYNDLGRWRSHALTYESVMYEKCPLNRWINHKLTLFWWTSFELDGVTSGTVHPHWSDQSVHALVITLLTLGEWWSYTELQTYSWFRPRSSRCWLLLENGLAPTGAHLHSCSLICNQERCLGWHTAAFIGLKWSHFKCAWNYLAYYRKWTLQAFFSTFLFNVVDFSMNNDMMLPFYLYFTILHQRIKD